MKKILFVFCFTGFVLISAFSQNIGIGTSNPTRAKLELHGTVGGTAAIFGGEGKGVSLLSGMPGIGFNAYYANGPKLLTTGAGVVLVYDTSAHCLGFDILSGQANQYALSRRAMALFYSGHLNIGASFDPLSTLNVARGNGYDGTAVFQGTTHRSHFNYSNFEDTYIRAGKDGGRVIINDIPGGQISLGGFVGIRTNNPVFPLEIRQPTADKGLALVNSNNWANWELRVTGSLGYLQLYYNGYYKGRFNENGAYSYISDNRLKTNVRDISSTLDKVMQLRPVEYEMIYNNPDHKKEIGFIAQDVKDIFPGLVSVSTDSASGYKGLQGLHTLNYSGFGPIAVKAIQEQQEIIKNQEKTLQLLKAEVEEMKRRMNALLPDETKITH